MSWLILFHIHLMPHHSHSHSPPNTRNNPIEGGDNIVLEENADGNDEYEDDHDWEEEFEERHN
jgi:hypothetical protein